METSYKEKYEDILARLAKAKNDNEVCDERFCCVINEIIPELAESEDEKIRKELIDAVQGLWDNDALPMPLSVKRKDYPILALVERDDQEEYQSFTKDGRFSLYNPLHDNFDLFIETADEVSEDEKIRKEIINYFHCQSEEEPTRKEIHDKWIAWLENIPYTIDHEKREGFYLGYKSCLERQGEKHPDPYNGISFEYNGHIWGMCARDNGVDISCDKHLIKHLEKQGEPNPTNKVEPKFKVGDKIYLKPEYRMPDDDTPIANTVKEIRRIDDKHYRFDGSYIFIEDQDKYELVEQKPKENKGNIGGISPSWSEEDEQYVEDTLALIGFGFSAHTIGEVQEWLHSLQDRVQPQHKQEWSEEDSFRTETLISVIKSGGSIRPELRNEFVNWLKSLRPQNRWKPSELQLGCLYDAIEYYNSFGYPAPKLKELYEQLKKIKEGKV